MKCLASLFGLAALAALLFYTTARSIGQPADQHEPAKRGPKAFSMHIGLNQVSEEHYGSAMKLEGCRNDALSWAALAEDVGIETPVVLLDEQATTKQFEKEIKNMAEQAQAGDFVLFTISAHGGRVLDQNGDEQLDNPNDFLDETWYFYDRQHLDDERWVLWHLFREGVRIVVIADTCHSGTSVRGNAGDVATRGPGGSVYMVNNAAVDHSRLAGGNERDNIKRFTFDDMFETTRLSDLRVLTSEMRNVLRKRKLLNDLEAGKAKSQLRGTDVPGAIRRERAGLPVVGVATEKVANLSFRVRSPAPRDQLLIYERHQELYDRLQTDNNRSAENDSVKASLLLLAACSDDEQAADGRENGAFTQHLIAGFRGWKQAGQQGTYSQLLEETALAMRRHLYTQTPTLSGTANARNLMKEVPFSVGKKP